MHTVAAIKTGLVIHWHNHSGSTSDSRLVEQVKGLALGEYKLMTIWVWAYCILWWFVQDFAKVGARARARAYGKGLGA